jgi:hypothetical protein
MTLDGFGMFTSVLVAFQIPRREGHAHQHVLRFYSGKNNGWDLAFGNRG